MGLGPPVLGHRRGCRRPEAPPVLHRVRRHGFHRQRHRGLSPLSGQGHRGGSRPVRCRRCRVHTLRRTLGGERGAPPVRSLLRRGSPQCAATRSTVVCPGKSWTHRHLVGRRPDFHATRDAAAKRSRLRSLPTRALPADRPLATVERGRGLPSREPAGAGVRAHFVGLRRSERHLRRAPSRAEASSVSVGPRSTYGQSGLRLARSGA